MLTKVEKLKHEIFHFESFKKKIRVAKVLLIVQNGSVNI
jgi:hypothetical protein